ncbi:hypothetical protein [Vulcanisaeta sp. JCM 16161]|uniref:hypothetical protein n=1 Tax=Vulcanisaeta sp. JCM 16161 TaxID=1295372 RepID=UPI001FB26BDA|nr:hypothetical protein [Vulcanisaeta sp. JCM 16161]
MKGVDKAGAVRVHRGESPKQGNEAYGQAVDGRRSSQQGRGTTDHARQTATRQSRTQSRREAMRTAPSPRHALGKNHPTNAHSKT